MDNNNVETCIIRRFDDVRWVICPYCKKKQFPVEENTRIKNLYWTCKGTNCKKGFKILVINYIS